MKSEARKPNSERNPNSEFRTAAALELPASVFGFLSNFGLRISEFVE